MSANTELATMPPKETALAVYSAANGLDPWLTQIRTEVDKFLSVLPDLATDKGRKAFASMAHKIAKSKTALDAVGKELSAQQKEVPKRIDGERKRVWDKLESWQKEVRKPLDDWEAAEARRIDAIRADIEKIQDHAMHLDGVSAADLLDRIGKIEAVVIADKWAEFQAEAALAKESTLTTLRASLVTRQKIESELEVIAKFNAEKAEREQKERDEAIERAAIEKVQREAAEAAQAERDASAKREQALIDQAAQAQRDADQKARDAEAVAERQALQLKLQTEQAERQALQAEADRLAAIKQAEQDRIDAAQRQAKAVEQARLDEIAKQNAAADEIIRQQDLREANKAHKGKINRAALDAFIKGGMPEACARQAVVLIANRVIPGVSIQY